MGHTVYKLNQWKKHDSTTNRRKKKNREKSDGDSDLIKITNNLLIYIEKTRKKGIGFFILLCFNEGEELYTHPPSMQK